MSFLCKEVLVTHRFLKSNFSVTVGLSVFAVLSRYIWDFPGWEVFFAVQSKMFSFAMIFQYDFEIVNQVQGVQEDVVNRPDRPIPSGLITLQGGYARWVTSWILTPVVGYAFCSLHAAQYLLWWLGWVTFCYVWPRFNQPLLKNAFAAVGVYILMRLLNDAAQSCGDSFNMPRGVDMMMGIWSLSTCQVQDFHDRDGDIRTGRCTLATCFAPSAEPLIRRIVCVLFLSWGLLFFGACFLTNSTVMHGLGLFSFFLHALTGLRFLEHKGQSYDHNTYKIHYIASAYAVYLMVSYFGRHGWENVLQLLPCI
ncbi:UbiA prenyltransferase family-domain-containing protein [Aspergillus aurantiobrunneus]